MRRGVIWILPLLAFVPALWADDKPKNDAKPKADAKAEKKGTPSEQFSALKKELIELRASVGKAFQAAMGDQAKQQQAREDFQKASAKILGECVQLAKDHPKDAIAGDVLMYVISNQGFGPQANEAFNLFKDHVDYAKLYDNPRLFGSPEREKFLREALAKIMDPKTKMQATFCLAKSLKSQNSSGKSTAEKAAMKEVESLFETVSKSPATDAKTKEKADDQLYAIRNIAVGKSAPDIAGEDVDGKKFKLSDYKGKVVLLDFWGNW